MKKVLASVVLMLAASCVTFGQSETVQPPKPSPEVQRLSYFVGTWKTEDETVTWEWFPGRFSLIGHVENVTPTAFSAKLEMSRDGGPWTVAFTFAFETKGVKIK